jgi:hypothetical protein
MEYLPTGKDQYGNGDADQSSQEDDGGFKVDPVFSKGPKKDHTDKKCKDGGASRPIDLLPFFISKYWDGMFGAAAHNKFSTIPLEFGVAFLLPLKFIALPQEDIAKFSLILSRQLCL